MNLRVFYLTRRGLSDGYRQNTSRAMKKATKPAGSIPLVSWLVLLLEA